MTKPEYEPAIAAARKLIADAVLAHEPDLVERARDVDAIVLGIVRDVGRGSTEAILNQTALDEAARVAREGKLVVEHHQRSPFLPSSEPSKSRRRTSAPRRPG